MKVSCWLPLVALAALGCSSLLGLDDFEDAPETGGAAGSAASGGVSATGGVAGTGAAPSGGAAGASATGGTSGVGGSLPDGGGGSPGTCDQMPVMDVFTEEHLGPGAVVYSDTLRVFKAVDSAVTTYIAVAYTKPDNTAWLAIRTYRDSDATLAGPANFVQLGSLFRVRAGYAEGNVLKVYGMMGQGMARLDYTLDKGNLTNGTPAITPNLLMPTECQNDGEHGSVFPDPGGNDVYVANCQVKTGQKRLVYLVIPPNMYLVAAGSYATDQDPACTARGVTHAASTWLVAFEDGNFYTGQNPAALDHWVLDLKKAPTDVSSFLGLVPLVGSTGALILPSRITPNPLSAALYAGVFPAADYPKLGDVTRYAQIADLTDLSKIPRLLGIKYSQSAVDAAGVSLNGKNVIFWKLTREGVPTVPGWVVGDVGEIDDTMNAAAAPIGLIYDVVAWTEKGKAKVRARRLLCQ